MKNITRKIICIVIIGVFLLSMLFEIGLASEAQAMVENNAKVMIYEQPEMQLYSQEHKTEPVYEAVYEAVYQPAPQYIVKFSEEKIDSKSQKPNNRINDINVKKTENIINFIKDKQKEKIKDIRNKKIIDNQYLILEIKSDMNASELIESVQSDMEQAGIEYIQEDYSLTLESSDPYFDKQWAVYFQNDSLDKSGNDLEVAVKNDTSDNVANQEKLEKIKIPALKEVKVNGASITKDELEKLKKLQRLDLENAEAIFKRPVKPHELEQLKKLMLGDKAPQIRTGIFKAPELKNDAYFDQKSNLGVNISEAWAKTEGEGAAIAVIDTGVDITHEDLASNILSNTGEIPDNGLDDDENGYVDDTFGWNFADGDNDVYDENNIAWEEHGTHIAGIISAVRGNGKGIEGTAPKARILPLKVFQRGRAYTSDIIEAIRYAEDLGINIVNCSFGTTENNPALEETIQGSGMLFICAAGNYSADLAEKPIYPAAYEGDNIISVASINRNAALSSFSNYSELYVDIAAPGEEIYSTLPENEYGYMNGTSMAAAFVSAEAALLSSMDYKLRVQEIRNRIINCTDRYSSLLRKVNNASKINCTYALGNKTGNGLIQIPNSLDEPRMNIALTSDMQLQAVGTVAGKKLAAGEEHCLYISDDGTVWAWGLNSYGQLGDGTIADRSNPVQVSDLADVSEVAAGDIHSLALKNDGTVWAWGYNYDGELGNGSDEEEDTPVQVNGLTDVIAIAAGGEHSLALRNDGTVWSWGSNDYGQLGNGGLISSNLPTLVSGMTDVISIAAGEKHSIVIRSDGTVWTWGNNSDGQLGDGTLISSSFPVQVSGLVNISSVDAGAIHSMALKSDGTVWTWGNNESAQLGNDDVWDYSSTPLQTTGMTEITAIAAGDYHNIVLRNDGTVWAWGDNWNGQLGNDSTDASIVPVQVHTIADVVSIAAGYCHNISLGQDNRIYAWGYNRYGQLGNGVRTFSSSLVPVSGMENVASAESGVKHSIAVKTDGTVWTWGYGDTGQLGNYIYYDSSNPVKVNGITGAVSADAGGFFSSVLRSDGTVWTWGANWDGELGNGGWEDSGMPVRVTGLSEVTAIASGEYHNLALKGNGAVWAWGENDLGQLGDGTWLDNCLPVQVSGLSNVIKIVAGYNHSLALKSDGTVWAWGYNEFGQLGDGTDNNRSTPVQVSGLSDVIAIGGGNYFSIALKNDGTVWTWGNNYQGELGSDELDYSLVPAQVSEISDIISISAGGYHCIVKKSDGTVWGWGYNRYGQLGTDIAHNVYTPIQIPEMSNMSDASCARNHTIVLQNSGELLACGDNTFCQLGDGEKDMYVSIPIECVFDSSTGRVGVPENINAVSTSRTITFSWDGVDEADRYEIELDGVIYNNDLETLYEYVDLLPNSAHTYRVRAINEVGYGDWSELKSKLTSPDIPGNISAASTNTSITLTWNEVEAAEGYDVEILGSPVDNGNSTIYTQSGLSPNTQRTYRVRAKNENGMGDWSEIIVNSTMTAAPSNITTISTETTIKFSWDQVSGAITYDAEVDGILFPDITSAEYDMLGLYPNSQHTFRVRAINEDGISDWSAEITGSTLPEIPVVTFTEATCTSVRTVWESVYGASDYEIEADGLIIDCGIVNEYVHQGLMPNSKHIYRVRARSEYGVGSWSELIERLTLPGIPNNLEAEATSSTVKITWSNVDGATGYEIESGGVITNTGINTSCHFEHLDPNTEYIYRIRAINEAGVGDWSTEVQAFTLLGVPQNIKSFSTSSNIKLVWEEVYGITGYEIEADGSSIDIGPVTEYLHTDLMTNTAHIYRIRAKVDESMGDWSQPLVANTLLASIADIKAISTNTTITLSWTPIGDAENYDVEVDGNIIAGILEPTYKLEGLLPNTSHTFRVMAKSETNTSDWCNMLTKYTTPDIPGNVVTSATTSAITISWDAVAGAVGYDIEADGALINNEVKTSYIQVGLMPNTQHIYRVRARNEFEASEWSMQIIGTTEPEFVFDVAGDNLFNFVIAAPKVEGATERCITVTYNPEELEVVDFCSATPEQDINVGDISGANLEVKEYTPGTIVLSLKDPSQVIMNAVKFKAKINGQAKILYVIE